MAQTQRISIKTHLDAFYSDCRAANLSDFTLGFYRDKLGRFCSWLTERGIEDIDAVTPPALRAYFTYLQDNHTTGGVDAYWRAVSAFLGYLERDDIIIVSPLRKLRRPKVDRPLQAPISLADIRALLRVCSGSKIRDLRDTAMFCLLLDTGIRAGELLALNVDDINLGSGEVQIRKAKNRQGRIVFISPKTRRYVRAYLRKRDDNQPAFMLSYSQRGQNRLDYDGLRAIFNARAFAAKIKPTSPHAFRRAFAITSWRNGIDVTSIARMMGHGSLVVLMRYIAAETADLAALHDKHAPTSNL